jgi:hypothetical protein
VKQSFDKKNGWYPQQSTQSYVCIGLARKTEYMPHSTQSMDHHVFNTLHTMNPDLIGSSQHGTHPKQEGWTTLIFQQAELNGPLVAPQLRHLQDEPQKPWECLGLPPQEGMWDDAG